MEQVRSRKLDNLCEAIGDEREMKNKADTEEKGLLQSALREMQSRNVHIYKHGGVELARVPGSEKLRVRLTKDEGDADVSSGTTTAQNAEEVPGDDGETLASDVSDNEATQH